MPSEPRPSARHVLLYTPLFDFLRGHAPGRLDARRAIASFDLPENLEHAVLRVARQTRLRRRERVAVAEDLAEHMRDGLDLGTPAETLLSDFGDEATAAQLIRRSMVRKRPHWARLPGYAVRGTLLVTSSIILFALITWTYLGMQIWFSSPKITVNYIERLNEPLLEIPLEDRAWPRMQEIPAQIDHLALQQLGWADNGVDAAAPVQIDLAETYIDLLLENAADIVWSDSAWPGQANPGTERASAHFSEHEIPALIEKLEDQGVDPQVANPTSMHAIEAFYQRATPVLAELRALTQRPALGYEVKLSRPNGSLFEVLMPQLWEIRSTSQRLLLGDILFAVRIQDSQRALEDIEALLDIARLGRTQKFVLSQLMATSIEGSAFRATRDILAVQPDFFDDQQLLELAQIIAIPDERLELSMEHERLLFEDIAQRVYSSSGQLLPGAFKMVKDLSISSMPEGIDTTAVAPFALALAPTRTEALRIWHEIMDHYEATSRVHRDAAPRITQPDVLDVYTASWNPPSLDEKSILTQYRVYASQFPLNVLVPALSNMVDSVYVNKQERDAARIAIALEQWRRGHGAWPENLSRLVPEHLAAVPRDQFDGQPLRYRLPGDRPLIYSVGRDGTDDAGTPNPTPDVHSEGWDIILWNGPSMK